MCGCPDFFIYYLHFSPSLRIFALVLCPVKANEPNQTMQNITPIEAEEEKFLSFLKTKGLRKTPERFEILHCALECKGHFDVDTLYKSLEARGYHVSKATVYNTLELLCAGGVIRKLLFDTHQARYELAEKTHSHLICTQCGEIKEIELEEIDHRLASMSFRDFYATYVSTCIYGICSKCEEQNKRESHGNYIADKNP